MGRAVKVYEEFEQRERKENYNPRREEVSTGIWEKTPGKILKTKKKKKKKGMAKENWKFANSYRIG